MKFLIDADSPYALMQVFKSHGHEAFHVRDIMPSAADDEIFEYAMKHRCIIVTRDLGFAITFLKNKGCGLLLVRLPYYFTKDRVVKVFDSFLKEVDANNFLESITVLELGRYRTKKV